MADRGCATESGAPKRRYPTAWLADRALHLVWRGALHGKQKSETLPCRAYKCPKCHGYHLSSKPIRK